MKLVKLISLSTLLFTIILGISSCEKDAEKKKITDFSKTGIALTGAQENPAVSSAATGSLDVFYTRETRTLTYRVQWLGLTDSVTTMHIHGLAPIGFNAGVVQNIIVPPALCTVPPSPVGSLPNCNDGTIGNGIFPQKTKDHKFAYTNSGTLSATLLVDGVFIKEQDLLNGLFYINIHTKAYLGGEIRAQIIFD